MGTTTHTRTDPGPEGGFRIGRRAFLKGSGVLLVLGSLGGVWRAGHRGVFHPAEGPAFEPWTDWQAEGTGGPTALVAAAILASNAHNTQPWLFRVQEHRIDLFCDPRRDLGALDPFSREIHLGLGCALENLLLAARAHGFRYRLTLAPDRSDPSHVATVELAPAGRPQTSPLYEAIPHRHTNRYPYDTTRPLPRSTFAGLDALNGERDVRVFWFTSKADHEVLHRTLARAAQAINDDEGQSYDNGPRWLRQDLEAIEHHRDGLTLDTMGLADPALVAAKMLPDPTPREAGQAWLSTVDDQAGTAGAFGILAVPDDRDRIHRLRSGRLWQRMHLWTTANGLAAQPMNQLHERADREAQLGLEPEFGRFLADLVAGSGWRAVFTFRIGHPTRPAPPSPRRPVEAVTG